MSKRGASNQISKEDGRDRDDDEEGESEGIFTSAAPAVISERKIRGLPSRKSTPVVTPLASPSLSSTPPAFGGFPGFASTPITTNLNPFAPTSSTTLTPLSTSSPFSFLKPSTIASSAPLVVASSAPSYSFNSTPAISPAPATSTPPALTYYLGLRALNVSLLEAIGNELELDQFLNLGNKFDGLKERYNSHRNEIVKEFERVGGKSVVAEEAKSGNADVEMSTPSSIPAMFTTPAPTTPTVVIPAKPALALPAPPTSFSWGGNIVKASTPSSSTSTAPPPPGSFIPNLPTKTVEVKKSLPPAVSIVAPKAPVLAAAKLSNFPTAPSPLRFGESVSPSSTPPTTTSAIPSKFSFGASFGNIAKGQPESTSPAIITPVAVAPVVAKSPFSFGSASTTTAASTNAPTLFSFGGALPSSSTPTISNPFASTATPIKSTTPISTFSTPPPVNPFAISSKSGGSPTFSFGAGLSSGGAIGAFGSLPGSTSTTGFGFGSSTISPSVAPSFGFGSTPSTNSISTGFSFGAAVVAPIPAAVETAKITEIVESEAGGDTEGGEESSSTTSNGFNTPQTIAEGEEDEIVLGSARAKVNKFVKGEFVSVGVAVVYVKERVIDGISVKRVLARNEGNNSVVMNFRIQPSLSVNIEKTFLSFLGAEGSEMTTYRLRLKTVEEAEKLKKDMESAAGSS